MAKTFDEYLDQYGRPDGRYPVVDLDTADEQRHTVIVTFAGGAKKAIVQFMGLAAGDDNEHLCLDVHAFVDDATSISQLGDQRLARRLFHEAVDGRRRVLGAEHPDTLNALINLGRALISLGDRSLARRLLREVYDVRERTLGLEHPDTIAALTALAPTLPELAPGVSALPAPGVPTPALIPVDESDPTAQRPLVEAAQVTRGS